MVAVNMAEEAGQRRLSVSESPEEVDCYQVSLVSHDGRGVFTSDVRKLGYTAVECGHGEP